MTKQCDTEDNNQLPTFQKVGLCMVMRQKLVYVN